MLNKNAMQHTSYLATWQNGKEEFFPSVTCFANVLGSNGVALRETLWKELVLHTNYHPLWEAIQIIQPTFEYTYTGWRDETRLAHHNQRFDNYMEFWLEVLEMLFPTIFFKKSPHGYGVIVRPKGTATPFQKKLALFTLRTAIDNPLVMLVLERMVCETDNDCRRREIREAVTRNELWTRFIFLASQCAPFLSFELGLWHDDHHNNFSDYAGSRKWAPLDVVLEATQDTSVNIGVHSYGGCRTPQITLPKDFQLDSNETLDELVMLLEKAFYSFKDACCEPETQALHS